MQTSTESVITSIVESFMPQFSDTRLGLLILLDLSYSQYKNNITVRKPVYYLIHRPSNYTKVFILDSLKDEDNFRCPPSYLDVINKKDLRWMIRSDHDSCWKSDGFRDLFKMECEIMDQFGGYPITPDKVFIHNTIGGITNGIYYVELAPFSIDREDTFQDVFINKILTIKEAALLMPEKQK